MFYILFSSRQVQKFKNFQKPTSTSKFIKKIKLIFGLFISIYISFEFILEIRFSGELQLIESCANVNHVRM